MVFSSQTLSYEQRLSLIAPYSTFADKDERCFCLKILI